MTLLIATPIRGAELLASHVTFGYAEYRAKLAQMMPVETIGPALAFSCDNIRARNRIVAHVLRTMPQVDRVLWWDDDQWPRDIAIVQRMIDSGEDFIAAPYTNKKQPLRWVHHPLDDNPPPDERGLIRIKRCGFGFTMTSRKCMEEMSIAAEWYSDYTDAGKFRTPNVFGMLMGDMPDGDRTLLSEDFSFCDRWRALSGNIWIIGSGANLVEHAGAHAWDATEMKGIVVTC